MNNDLGLNRHCLEAQRTRQAWEKKPLLRDIYAHFYKLIAAEIPADCPGLVVELGSGIGNVKEFIPHCLRTDLFPNPWLDRTEDAYALSFADESAAAIILLDVFHHLRYPGQALAECRRVLKPGGRLIVFEPCLSLLGLMVYGLFHHEPLGLGRDINWMAPSGWRREDEPYYAAEFNAWRIFIGKKFRQNLQGWRVIKTKPLSAISYAASGGYKGPQLYPRAALPFMRLLDRAGDMLPRIFATRLLATLAKE